MIIGRIGNVRSLALERMTNMLAAESVIAKKHITISNQIKRIVMTYCKDCCVYVATHTNGTRGQAYQRIEEECNEEFWSVIAWTKSPDGPHRPKIKELDAIVTRNEDVAFLIEVKWGTSPGRPDSDLMIKPDEWAKMRQLLQGEAICRVRGPSVRNGQRYHSPEFQQDYYINPLTKGIIVSDFHEIGKTQLDKFLRGWREANSGFIIADIGTGVDGIPSFREIVAGKL